jgi:hypothetical protein
MTRGALQLALGSDFSSSDAAPAPTTFVAAQSAAAAPGAFGAFSVSQEEADFLLAQQLDEEERTGGGTCTARRRVCGLRADFQLNLLGVCRLWRCRRACIPCRYHAWSHVWAVTLRQETCTRIGSSSELRSSVWKCRQSAAHASFRSHARKLGLLLKP